MKKLCCNLINIVFLLVMLYIFLLNVFTIGKERMVTLVLAGVICVGVLWLFKSKNKKHLSVDKNIIRKLSFALIIVNFIFILFLGYKLRVNFTWDYGRIQEDSIYYASYSNLSSDLLHYYIRYPNNRFIFIVLSNIYRIAYQILHIRRTGYLVGISIILNVIMIESALVSTYLLAKKYKGDVFAFMVLISLFIMFPLLAYSTIFYSDTLSLIFYPLIFLLYLKSKEKLGESRLMYLILLTFVSVLGFEIKATIIFALLAVMIDIFINNNFKNTIKSFSVILLSMIACFFIFDKGMNLYLNVSQEDINRYQFPHTHHIMMMLNKTGEYVENDVSYTGSFNSIKEKRDANIALIKSRILARGTLGTLYHLFYTKVKKAWTISTFSSEVILGLKPVERNIWNELVTKDGKFHFIFKIYTDVYWLLIIVGLIFSFTFNKDENCIIMYGKLIILLLFSFLIIWECTSRYVVQIIPIMVLISLVGWRKIYKERGKRNEK